MKTISVVIRSGDSALTIERALRSVRRQTVDAEIILVDSGSTDDTLRRAAPYVDKVVTIAKTEFTYGRALNLGFEASTCDIVHPLSSHCELKHEEHLAWVRELHTDELVIATNGIEYDANGEMLRGPIFLSRWPSPPRVAWGFSNHSSSVRRSVWERVRFDESLLACEDKEWALRAYSTNPSWTIAYDPRLMVAATHRNTHGLRPLYRRAFREGHALQTILSDTALSTPTVLREWVLSVPQNTPVPAPLYRLLPHRWCTALGVIRGARAARSGMTG